MGEVPALQKRGEERGGLGEKLSETHSEGRSFSSEGSGLILSALRVGFVDVLVCFLWGHQRRVHCFQLSEENG